MQGVDFDFDFDFGVDAISFELFLQRVLGERFALIIVLGDGDGDGDQEVVLHLGYQQVGAILLVGDEAASMECSGSANALGQSCRSAHNDRSTHAVAHGAHLAAGINSVLAVEEG